jgi:hypothetical protein
MSNLILKCPKCATSNPIDIFKAEESSRILCKKCNTFINLEFKDGVTPKTIKENIVKEIKKAFPKTIKIKI